MTEQNTSQDVDSEESSDLIESETVAQDTLDDTQVESEQEESREVARQKTREGQLRRAKELLENGESLPESLQWAAKELTPTQINEEALLQKLEDKQLFKSLSKEWQDLPKTARTLVKEKWTLYKSKGFTPGEALAEAMSFAENKTVDSGERKAAASLPKPGKRSETEKEFDPLTASEDEIIANMKKKGLLR